MKAITTGTPTAVPCGRCHRPLRSAASIARGYGRACWTKTRAATQALGLDQYSDRVATKAEELLETPGAIRRLRGLFFQVVGSAGATYITTPDRCGCPAGQRGKHMCNHRVAVRALALSLGLWAPAPPQPRRTFDLAA
ncbi:DUF6011 domain-containing protein [Nocardiopsis sp. FR26]|uniref:DUF6011 domain-containing protein n=1 Tax=Nocardiopsis sp. FR26 TaxID=2605987 RepID=UPI0013576F93|nr:DUF6011 domain-containing protein [Nocardiopsis sp. FR26]